MSLVPTIEQVHVEQVAKCGRVFHHAASKIGCDVMRRIADLLSDPNRLPNYYKKPNYTNQGEDYKPEIEIKLPLFLGYDLLETIDLPHQLMIQSELERALADVASSIRLQMERFTHVGADRSDKLTIVLRGELI